ncbi:MULTISPECIES: aromatic acid exporter family protein [unclassified Isoptericola]|uniref:aromatic acid exporter family protein n=1 Tax=unclassified Isoptericola TaxID=2623355 RepID=UPI0036693CB0
MTGTETSGRRVVRAVHRAWVLHPRWSLAVRGAVAAGLAWAVAVLAPAPFSEYPFYAPLGAVVATTATPVRSLRESLHTVGALLLGALIALVADAVLAPSVLAVALVVGVALLCAGWRVLGGAGVWVANSAIFVLVLGQGEDASYVAAFAGLILVGALIGTGVNLLLPSLALAPSDVALDALRDALAEELDDLAGWLEHEGALDAAEWERRRQALVPTIERARRAVDVARESSRGNLRAHRHSERASSQGRRARTLGTAAGVVDEVVRLLVDWEASGRDDVALGPPLRPAAARTLQALAAALQDTTEDDEAARRFVDAVDDLRAEVRDSRERSGDDHLVAGALVVVLGRATEAVTG